LIHFSANIFTITNVSTRQFPNNLLRSPSIISGSTLGDFPTRPELGFAVRIGRYFKSWRILGEVEGFRALDALEEGGFTQAKATAAITHRAFSFASPVQGLPGSLKGCQVVFLRCG
jgi:hypothetical protein